MHLLHRVLMLSGALVFVAAQAQAQIQPDPTASAKPSATASYDPRITFAPLTLPDPVNAYRSSNGAPGPSYWQNEADYEMHADLDTKAKVLHNDEVITYTNNSPDALPSASGWLPIAAAMPLGSTRPCPATITNSDRIISHTLACIRQTVNVAAAPNVTMHNPYMNRRRGPKRPTIRRET